jgi:hypothetical protein
MYIVAISHSINTGVFGFVQDKPCLVSSFHAARAAWNKAPAHSLSMVWAEPQRRFGGD